MSGGDMPVDGNEAKFYIVLENGDEVRTSLEAHHPELGVYTPLYPPAAEPFSVVHIRGENLVNVQESGSEDCTRYDLGIVLTVAAGGRLTLVAGNDTCIILAE